MKIVIAEDEVLAAERLQNMVIACAEEPVSTEHFDSVDEVVRFFKAGNSADLLLLDIQLADGKSFEIFDRVNIEAPIIFTTAYDQYALHAFKFHSIDYLLKPVQATDLKAAFKKLKKISTGALPSQELIALKEFIRESRKKFRERFIIKVGNKLQFKQAEDVAYFYAEGKTVYLVTRNDNRKYIVDHTLEELERTLDPVKFFRASRKYIVCVDCIMEVKGLISGKLEIRLAPPCNQSIEVSRERAQEFKSWLNR